MLASAFRRIGLAMSVAVLLVLPPLSPSPGRSTWCWMRRAWWEAKTRRRPRHYGRSPPFGHGSIRGRCSAAPRTTLIGMRPI